MRDFVGYVMKQIVKERNLINREMNLCRYVLYFGCSSTKLVEYIFTENLNLGGVVTFSLT